ncbi:MAG: Bax inhibitor-1/YccA family protein [Phycisphaerales bacterium]|jgi:uncharacterized YccA/Bax inhibitor family protein
MNLQSSNPVLAGSDANELFRTGGESRGAVSTTATVQGVVNKTTLLALMATAAGCVGWGVCQAFPGALWIVNIASFVVVLGIFFALRGNPARAIWAAPLYAVVEGFLLGGVSMIFQQILTQQGIQVPGGIALQAFVVTIAIMLSMLTLYSLGVLKGGETFTRILWVATAGIMLTYFISFIMSLFGAQMPFLSIGSALEGGTAGYIGLGINVLILGVAALWFIVDFRQVEELVASGAPKQMEWYAAFGLIVTLAWVYLEALKLVFRLALLFGRRD